MNLKSPATSGTNCEMTPRKQFFGKRITITDTSVNVLSIMLLEQFSLTKPISLVRVNAKNQTFLCVLFQHVIYQPTKLFCVRNLGYYNATDMFS